MSSVETYQQTLQEMKTLEEAKEKAAEQKDVISSETASPSPTPSPEDIAQEKTSKSH